MRFITSSFFCLKRSLEIEEKVAQALLVNGILQSKYGVITCNEVDTRPVAEQVLIGECQVFWNPIAIPHCSLVKVAAEVNTERKRIELIVVDGSRKVKTGVDQLVTQAIFLDNQLLPLNHIEFVASDEIRSIANSSYQGVGLIGAHKPACC